MFFLFFSFFFSLFLPTFFFLCFGLVSLANARTRQRAFWISSWKNESFLYSFFFFFYPWRLFWFCGFYLAGLVSPFFFFFLFFDGLMNIHLICCYNFIPNLFFFCSLHSFHNVISF